VSGSEVSNSGTVISAVLVSFEHVTNLKKVYRRTIDTPSTIVVSYTHAYNFKTCTVHAICIYCDRSTVFTTALCPLISYTRQSKILAKQEKVVRCIPGCNSLINMSQRGHLKMNRRYADAYFICYNRVIVFIITMKDTRPCNWRIGDIRFVAIHLDWRVA
jgi:hypothetical protein